MDREELKRDFGDRVVFHGAMDNQHTLPCGNSSSIMPYDIDSMCWYSNRKGVQ